MILYDVDSDELTPDVIKGIKNKSIKLDSGEEGKDYFLALSEAGIAQFKDVNDGIVDVEDVLKHSF